MEKITTLNDYQEATNTVAVYPGSDPELGNQIADKLIREATADADKADGPDAEAYLKDLESVIGGLRNAGLMYTSLGLAGESGEFCDKVKKMLRDSGGVVTLEIRRHLALELGDVQWYVAQSAEQLGFSLEEIANMNMAKLLDRKARSALGGSGDSR